MSTGKAVAGAARGRVTVPRIYFLSATRGLRHIPWWFGSSDCSPLAGKHPLDEALRYAERFQRRSLRLWSEALSVSSPHRGRAIPVMGEEYAILSHTTSTLESLVDADGRDVTEQRDAGEVSVTFSEKQQARLHTALQQWVTYCAFQCTRAEFIARQSLVAQRLLLSRVVVLPFSTQNRAGAASLERSVRRRGARAYVDLLVHHQVGMQRQEEWNTLLLYSPTTQNECQQWSSAAVPTVPVVRLPFTQAIVDEPSWERSLAILSWAMHFREMDNFHIPSSDVATVLRQYVRGLEDRLQLPKLCQSITTEDQVVIQQLQQWWSSAREGEQQNARLAAACGLDRTAFDSIRVEGRRVTASFANKDLSKNSATYAELLLQGRWEDALRHIELVAIDVTSAIRDRCADVGTEGGITSLGQSAKRSSKCTDGEEREEVVSIAGNEYNSLSVGTGSNVTSRAPAATDAFTALFSTPRPVFIKKKLWARSSAGRLGRPPREYLLASETPAEAILLQKPPVVGLRSRRIAVQGAKDGREMGSVGDESGEADAGGKMQPGEGNSRAPSTELVELRRKLWILRQLPPHLSHSLVRFEGTGPFKLPYLLRCPAKEVLPWFLLSIVAFAHSRHEGCEELVEVFRATRLQVLYTLFVPHAHYAAFQEYCADLLLQVGSLIVPPTVLRTAVRVLLEPPLFYHFYDVLRGRRLPVEVECRRIWSGSTDVPDAGSDHSCSTPLAVRLDDLCHDISKRNTFFVDKAHSVRNYHLSTWIEACSKVETLPRLLEVITEEVNMNGPPLLSPEAAAAVLTAVIIPHIGAGEDKKPAVECSSALLSLGFLWFAIPRNKAFGAAPFFKGVYDERYVVDAGFEWISKWDGAEALLVGRSLRQVTMYPTSTTESFFRVERRFSPMVTHRVPQLCLRLMKVDLLEALQHFKCGVKLPTQQGAILRSVGDVTTSAGGMPMIVARNLPFGVVAVNKPAGMSTTLHVGHPHLLTFLSQNLPWKGASTPVLFQHGLVNRIDLGTSGLVLAADTEASLTEARRASIVKHCVEKVYRALLLHCPPPVSRMDASECWFLSLHGVIMCDVLAHGADYSLQVVTHDLTKRGNVPVEAMDRRSATTVYRVLQYFPRSGVYYVEVQLRTGRRHQIRQHFAQLSHPLLGDGRYNKRAQSVGEELSLYRPALHAVRVTLTPCRGETIAPGGNDGCQGQCCGEEQKTVVECPLPADMQKALKLLRERENATVSVTSIAAAPCGGT